MGNKTWDGVVYAVSERHLEISLERRDGTRFVVQPELWNWADAMRWVEERVTLYATGLEAAGLPVLMRATVTEMPALPAAAATPPAGDGALGELQYAYRVELGHTMELVLPISREARAARAYIAALERRNATLTAALERIDAESDLRLSAYLNEDDMLRDYIGKVVRMKQAAADTLREDGAT